MIKSAQSVTVDFTTVSPVTGAATDATGTPVGTLVVNGTDNGASVTVTNKATGVYKAAVTLPSLTAGDLVQIRVAATVAGVAGVGVIWQEVADTKRVSDLNDLAAGDEMDLVDAPNATAVAAIQSGLATPTNITAGTITTVTNLTNAPTNGDLTAVMKASVNAEIVDVLRIDTIPDDYAADGDQPTFAQAILAIQQYLFDKSLSGTTLIVKKPDGSSTAMTFTLDAATAPTSQTRSA